MKGAVDMNYQEQAKAFESELQVWRRYLHQYPEIGLDLPITTQYIKETLQGFGLEPKEISPSGILCEIEGKEKGKTFLLRGDSDGLPMAEETSLPFKSKHENRAHSCGHDMHTTMLLGAAKLLSENRDTFRGVVKLMFQPGEETLQGAASMIEAGLLENPHVDAALGMHVLLDGPAGGFAYGSGYMSSSSDSFHIKITGKGCHGAMPHQGIDPIAVAVHIYLTYQHLIARENPTNATTALSVGELSAGSVSNIIPETAIMKGTLRTYDPQVRCHMRKRIEEIAVQTGALFNATVEFTWTGGVPSILSDETLVKELVGYIDKLGYDFRKIPDYKIFPSEDFALVSEKVTSTYLLLYAKKEGNDFPHHSPFVDFDEAALPLGAAIYAQCATQWLNHH